MVLGTVQELAAYAGRTDLADNDPSALMALRVGRAAVAGWLGFDPEPVDGDTEILDPLPLARGVALPGWPVRSLTTVKILPDDRQAGADWQDVTGLVGLSTQTGIVVPLLRHAAPWPTLPGSWQVTYSHGLDPVPDAIVAAVVMVAGAAFASAPGLKSESQGGWSATYADGAITDNSAAAILLRPWRLAVVS